MTSFANQNALKIYLFRTNQLAFLVLQTAAPVQRPLLTALLVGKILFSLLITLVRSAALMGLIMTNKVFAIHVTINAFCALFPQNFVKHVKLHMFTMITNV